ncbi:SEC-C metal-binding domain-containing protein [Dyella terrae]|uniref:SEC-C metal-binding domain-containing protein n=1 Tax=Dyella terrae TaxID=522259 RepID=UPI003D18786C|nr:SEC-C domain-containing protein [Dyella terrae]
MAASTTLRLPEALKADADDYASRVGVSLNALCLIALRDYLDARRGIAPVRPGQREAASPPDALAEPAQNARAEEVRREMEKAQQRSVLSVPRVGANQPCPCGSGEKYKRCHGKL